jgi:tetratricopeptide (TPR) repeat protein
MAEQKKTNLLDAVYFLSFCKSAGNPIDSQNIRHDADFFVIQGFYEASDGTPEEIYCGMKRRQKKQFKRNKKEYTRLSDHIGFLPLVMVSPADSALINGGSDERRRFMDVVISQYDKEYLDALIRYNKALDSFDGNDQMVAPAMKGAMGNCYAQLGQLDKASSMLLKAADEADNTTLSPIYLKQAGEILVKQGKYDDAIKAYTSIKEKYFRSYQAMDIDKYIEQAKLLKK